MIKEESPTAITFKLPQGQEALTEISDKLPRRYLSYQITDATVEFTEGPFGVYFTQKIQNKYWIINWFNSFIKQPVRLLSVTDQPIVAMHCNLKGNISCKLDGYGKLTQQKKKYGFYYIPAQINNTIDLTAEDYDAVYISLSSDYLAEFVDQHPYFKELYINKQDNAPQGTVLPSFTIGPDELNILEAIKHCTLQGPAKKIFLQARINDLMVKYFLALELGELNGDAVNESERRFREMEIYIRQNYHLPLSIQALSRQAGMNIRSFEKGFRKFFDFPPREYIELRRLTEASELLAKTNMPVTSISHQVGFTGANYFAVVFRKHYNCTPRQYRQQHTD